MPCITERTALDRGRVRLRLDNGNELLLYRSELRQMQLEEEDCISEADYRYLLEAVGKRAKRRAMHLLEKMDRTERELRDKLSSAYPPECVDSAIAYVSGFHYLDDYRYACNYIRCHKSGYSKRQLRVKLAGKGVGRELAARAMEEEYQEDESAQIRAILAKRRFAPECGEREFARNYRYLLGKGFSGDMVLGIMRAYQ